MPTPCSHSDRTKHTRAALMEFCCMPHTPQLSSNTPTKHFVRLPGVGLHVLVCVFECIASLRAISFHFSSDLHFALATAECCHHYMTHTHQHTNTQRICGNLSVFFFFFCMFMAVCCCGRVSCRYTVACCTINTRVCTLLQHAHIHMYVYL